MLDAFGCVGMQMRDEQGHKTKEKYCVQRDWQRRVRKQKWKKEKEGDARLVGASAEEQPLVN